MRLPSLLLPVCLLGFLISIQAEPMRIVSVTSSTLIRPVLIGLPQNPLLQLQIQTEGKDAPLTLEGLRFSLEGTTHLPDIAKLNVFVNADTSSPAQGSVFGFSELPGMSLQFTGTHRLSEGLNVCWLVCELSRDADLDHRIGAKCDGIQLSGNFLEVEENHARPLRIGYAVRRRGEGGIDTHRIPGLIRTNKESLIAVYDTRRNNSTDLQEDIDIGMSRSTDGGQSWSRMHLIMDMGQWGGKPEVENGIGDPSILFDPQTETIWVAAVWAHGHPGERNWWASKPGMHPEQTSQFMLVNSRDDGLTWSQPINITAQIKDPGWHLLLQGPGKGMSMRDGTLVFPAQFKDENQMPHSTIIYSKDHGKSWKIGTGAKSNTTEAQVVERTDGSLMLNMRDNRGREREEGGARSVAITYDMGKTWIEHGSSETALPEPVCMASLIRTSLPNGKPLFLFSNPAVPKGPRRRMTLKASLDEGDSWPEAYHLLLNEEHSFGYSCLSMVEPETVGILYEGRGELIYQRIGLNDLLGSQPMSNVVMESAEGLTIRKQDIFPPQFQHTHGSTIVSLPNGDLLTAWFQGSGERQADDVAIMGARFSKDTEAWSSPFLMADVPDFPDINPVLFIDQTEQLWLFWYTVLANQWETSILKYKVSRAYQQAGPPHWQWQEVLHMKPGGPTERGIQEDDPFFTAVRDKFAIYSDMLDKEQRFDQYGPAADSMRSLYEGRVQEILSLASGQDWVRRGKKLDVKGNGLDHPMGYPRFRRIGWQTRNKPLQLANGRLIIPLYSDGFDFSIMAITDDQGAHWTFSEPLVGLGPVQPSLLQRKDGTIMALMRDNGPPPQRLMQSESFDQGQTWTPVTDSEIWNPGSGSDMIRLADGRWVLANNDTEDGRHVLALHISEDEGKNWTIFTHVEQGEKDVSRFHYPAIVQDASGTVHLSYSYSRRDSDGQQWKTIRHATIELE
ncbi:MAG: exo-alpha-sialidase [Bacteroidota bacterium]